MKPGEYTCIDWIPITPRSIKGHKGAYLVYDRKTKLVKMYACVSKRELLDVFKQYITEEMYANGHTPRYLIADSEAIFLTWGKFRRQFAIQNQTNIQ